MDGERYLRLLLEECLADPGRANFAAAAGALASVDAVPPDTAEALTADFELAQQLRGTDGPGGLRPLSRPMRHRDPMGQVEPAGLDSISIAIGPVVLTTADGPLTLSWITTGPGATLHGSLAFDPVRLPASPVPPPLAKGPRRPRLAAAAGGMSIAAMPRQAPWRDLHIVDDQGTAYGSAGGSSVQRGETYAFDTELVPPPPIDARWFEIAGADGPPVRLPVVSPAAAPIPVVTERPRSLAELYLLHEVFSAAHQAARFGGAPVGNGGWPSESGSVADALVGVGALPASHPLVTQARLVERGDVLDPQLDVRLQSALRPPAGAQAPDPRKGLWPVGTAVRGPGFALRVDVISDDGSATCLFGRVQPAGAGDFSHHVLAARDDIGQWYLPGFHGGRGSGGEMSIEWQLFPRLDPDARHLTLVIMGRDTDIEIPVPLS